MAAVYTQPATLSGREFVIRKASILDRIIGYFRMRRYMKRFNAQMAERTRAIEDMREEKILNTFILLSHGSRLFAMG